MNPFDLMYEGQPPWEVGHPQPELVRLSEERRIQGRILDIGCGTGENALFLATRGAEIVGIDVARKAVASARTKAADRGLFGPDFRIQDALQLQPSKERFDTVIDFAFFHALTDGGREKYSSALRCVMKPGATLFLLCFSEREPNWGGPRRVTQHEIREHFSGDWAIEWIRDARYDLLSHTDGARAWLSSIVYLGGKLGIPN